MTHNHDYKNVILGCYRPFSTPSKFTFGLARYYDNVKTQYPFTDFDNIHTTAFAYKVSNKIGFTPIFFEDAPTFKGSCSIQLSYTPVTSIT